MDEDEVWLCRVKLTIQRISWSLIGASLPGSDGERGRDGQLVERGREGGLDR